jgi:hypothetical protein
MLKTKCFFRIICLANKYCLLFEVSGRIISQHLALLWWPFLYRNFKLLWNYESNNCSENLIYFTNK